MTFLQFKKKFIELYNQQKFERFPKDIIDTVLAVLDFEEVQAPSLVKSISMSAIDHRNVDLETVATLESCLYEILGMDEFDIYVDLGVPNLNPLVGANLNEISIDSEYTVADLYLNSSGVLDGFATEQLKFKSDFSREYLRVSPPKDLSSVKLDTIIDADRANMTFFTNWVYMDQISINSAAVYSPVTLNSSVNYSLGDIEQSAKLYESATMRSMTEYYVSHYTDNDDYISDVEDLTLHEFIYHEL